jgi:hypothetical protein
MKLPCGIREADIVLAEHRLPGVAIGFHLCAHARENDTPRSSKRSEKISQIWVVRGKAVALSRYHIADKVMI